MTTIKNKPESLCLKRADAVREKLRVSTSFVIRSASHEGYGQNLCVRSVSSYAATLLPSLNWTPLIRYRGAGIR